jgi:hypothetical protein
MDLQEIAASFLNSAQGQQALSALGDEGVGADDAQRFLGHATEAAMAHVQAQHEASGLLGEHAGRNFFAALAAGLVKGDGVMGSLEDGAIGVVTGRITEALVEKAGLDGGTASTIAAAATPYITSFLKEKLGGS